MAARKGGELTLKMFAGRTKTGRNSLLAQAENILASGYVPEPAWMPNMRSSPPSPPAPLTGKPPKIEFPEDKLIDRYYKRNPNARFVPINLRGDGPHFVQRYAWRQLELMQGGLSEEEARKQMDRDVAEAQRRLEKSGPGRRKSASRDEDEALASMAPPPRTRQFIPVVQADEEEVLQHSAAAKAGLYDVDDDDEEYEEDDEEEEDDTPPAADRQA